MQINIDTQTLTRKFEENPVAFMAAAGGLLMGFGKIIEAVGNSRGSHAYARDVNRRIKAERRK
jgi:hypothetical protein